MASSLHAAICCLLLFIVSNEAFLLSATACSSSDVALCADLGNITSPFWPTAACAASDSFVVSNCSSAHAYWDSFAGALSDGGDADGLGFPEFLGIRKIGFLSYINLTWTANQASRNQCSAPFPAANVSSLLPDVIDLTSFANGTVSFTASSYFLLFGCSADLANISNVIPESSACSIYKQHCQMNMSCAQLYPVQNLSLRQSLETYSCSSFTFLAAGNASYPPSQWRSAAIQLVYIYPKCLPCVGTTTACSSQCLCEGANQCGCKGLICTPAAVAGIAAAVALLVITACMAVVLWVHCRRNAYSAKSIATRSSNRLVTQRAYLLSKKFGPVSVKEFSFESLSKATKSFSDEYMIGDGGFGVVYLGILKDGSKVAIKRLYHDNFKRMDHFYNEIQILSKLNHPNLVKLYGFCCQDSNDLLLVFEYAANGTVSDQLHDSEKPPMPWKTRLSILRETAEALSYLHNCAKPPIYHRDVKTKNILLDENLHVKLGDFGLSRLVPLEATHISTAPQGTPGYLDPDYHQCYQLTDKSDVYSFGVVLVELVSAKLAVDMSRDRSEINLSSLALMKIGCGFWQELVDPCLEMDKNPEVETMVKRVLELAFMCLHAEKDSRPTMEYITESLSNLCQQFGYNDEFLNQGSFTVTTSPTSSLDETKRLMRDKQASNSNHDASFTPAFSDWSSTCNSSSFGS